ncbi:MAG: DUF1868 domain-containing protein [Jaaginema sp. PMC 1079.18]|nr:DUF1868 domain-containing protein [Jaaginema sp. PMC 1080.18]MEC4853450.1 DUF1868 domain-containing protein [Jaaginema sp. PMC 1079.18]MEC4867215.1 DUF1868 domain-containing protein [Jaaginema sp. PMC 1078.18]
MDDTYQSYLNRVARLTRAATQHTQIQTLQESPKFKGSEAVAFPGYSVMTAIASVDTQNTALYEKLATLQQELVSQTAPGLLVPVKPETFHLTLADLIWEDAYRQAVQEKPDYETLLRDRIAQSFQKCHNTVSQGTPLKFELLGIILRPRAISVGLVPQSEADFQRLQFLRRTLYQDPNIIALGIEQQYNFTAHLTLGYFGTIAPDLDRDALCNTLANINDNWLDREFPVFTAASAQLWKFEDMSTFQRDAASPELNF